MTIGMRPGPTRVNGARIRQYGRSGGARSGEQSGLAATIGKSGRLIRWIKKRVNNVLQPESIAVNLSNAVSAGTGLTSLIQQGYKAQDFIEAFGIVESLDVVFSRAENSKKHFNDVGISDEVLKSAGVIGNDFSRFSAIDLFKNNPKIRPTQVVLALNAALTGGSPSETAEYSTATKLSVVAEFYDLYFNTFSSSQKENADIWMGTIDPAFQNNLKNGKFEFLFNYLV